MKKTIKKLLISVMVLVMLGGNGIYAFAKTESYNKSYGTWSVTNTITVTSSKTTSKIKGANLKGVGYYAVSATCYDKNGKNVAYKGAYKTGSGADVTAKKAFKVKKGKACSWVNDNNKARVSKIWSKTINK